MGKVKIDKTRVALKLARKQIQRNSVRLREIARVVENQRRAGDTIMAGAALELAVLANENEQADKATAVL